MTMQITPYFHFNYTGNGGNYGKGGEKTIFTKISIIVEKAGISPMFFGVIRNNATNHVEVQRKYEKVTSALFMGSSKMGFVAGESELKEMFPFLTSEQRKGLRICATNLKKSCHRFLNGISDSCNSDEKDYIDSYVGKLVNFISVLNDGDGKILMPSVSNIPPSVSPIDKTESETPSVESADETPKSEPTAPTPKKAVVHKLLKFRKEKQMAFMQITDHLTEFVNGGFYELGASNPISGNYVNVIGNDGLVHSLLKHRVDIVNVFAEPPFEEGEEYVDADKV